MRKSPKKHSVPEETVETLTVEKDDIDFDIVPRHPINGPVSDVHDLIRNLIPALREAIEQSQSVPHGATSHKVAEHVRLNRIHSALCDLQNAIGGFY
jgi:hypothetical protein